MENNSTTGNTVPLETKLKIIRKALGLNQREFSKLLGMSQPTYSRSEDGSSEICSDALRVLFVEHGVSPSWYFLEVGPMFYRESTSEKELDDSQLILKKD
ncbi:MAG: helix-turn-helix transcriptional regulator [Sulfurimonas sp.]|jgi:transcriptional regulator with XRE-family HTH domain